METGQETPVTLLRILRDCGADNIGQNLAVKATGSKPCRKAEKP
ncbi:hypothetical protein FACS1894196_2730 [Clostridia bacterium]|nr:hypothetical protein FACS1894196_2730 [Clostridia bacterium]